MHRGNFRRMTALLMGASALVGGAQADDAASESGWEEKYFADEVVVEGTYLSLDKLNGGEDSDAGDRHSTERVDRRQRADRRPGFHQHWRRVAVIPGVSVSQGEGHRDAIVIRGTQTTADFFIDGLRDDVQYFRPCITFSKWKSFAARTPCCSGAAAAAA